MTADSAGGGSSSDTGGKVAAKVENVRRENGKVVCEVNGNLFLAETRRSTRDSRSKKIVAEYHNGTYLGFVTS